MSSVESLPPAPRYSTGGRVDPLSASLLTTGEDPPTDDGVLIKNHSLSSATGAGRFAFIGQSNSDALLWGSRLPPPQQSQ